MRRRLSALEYTASARVRGLIAADKADTERQQAERDAGGETEPVQFLIVGFQRHPDFGK